MKRHFVIFYSPGTLFAETSSRQIDKWDVDLAMEIAHEIVERHGAIPYGFRFSTRTRGKNDLDSYESENSRMYFLGGQIMTLKELEKLNNPDDKILISNMRINGYKRVVINTNSWKWVQPFNKGDIVLDWHPKTLVKDEE